MSVLSFSHMGGRGEQLFTGYCPVNNSKAKQLYSFPKGQRFKPPKKQLAPSFGVGDRFRQPTGLSPTNNQKHNRNRLMTPNNNNTNKTLMFIKTTEDIDLPSEFSPSRDKGYSFGASREVYKKVFTKTQPYIPNPEQPGPGSYDIKTFVERMANDNKNFVIGTRDNHEFPLNFAANPGPGYYNDNTNLNSHGTYFHSKFSNSGSQKFSKNPRNFLRIKNGTPGPGQYNPKTLINLDGKYFVSNYKNSLVRKFGSGSNNAFMSTTGGNTSSLNFSMDIKKQQSQNINDRLNQSSLNGGSGMLKMHSSLLRNGTPGPGSYRIISEFGKYDMSNNSTTAGGYNIYNNHNHNTSNNMGYNSVSPGLIDTSATTPVKRAFSAIGQNNGRKGGKHRRARSSMVNDQINKNEEIDLHRDHNNNNDKQ